MAVPDLGGDCGDGEDKHHHKATGDNDCEHWQGSFVVYEFVLSQPAGQNEW